MTRELKFKFYVHSEKRMIESIGFVFECQTQIRIWYRKNDMVYNESFATHDVSQLQYTGLKDRKGIEIYEGDILSVCNGSINNSPWMNEPYAVEYILNKGYNICLFCWDKNGNSIMDSTHYCEVIGNIYQNPELLNKK